MDLRSLHATAADQRDLLTAAQLRAGGVTKGALDQLVRLGRLHVVHHGVYSLGVHRDREDRWLAAVLACGPGAVLSHRCAGAHWGFLTGPLKGIEVSAATRGRVGPSDVTVHRPRKPPPRKDWEGIPVTPPLRTLVDLADVLSFDDLLTTAMEADHRRRVDLRRLRPIPGRRGTPKIERLLEYSAEGSRSEFEALARELLPAAGLPRFEANVRVHGRLLDCVWPDHQVAVEFDSYAFHRQRRKFESDRRVGLELDLHGWHVKRVTWRQLRHETQLVVASIAAALQQRGWARSAG